ncbi:hypothetical protein CYCD_05910 [Tenuifilaceae bacterium CYCD]|nr:hypothetical protein CYCD_05910 [Tenuifilaceae bacterium CYCD]
MSDTMISKLTKVLSWIMMGVSLILTVGFYAGKVSEGPYIVWAYILFGIAGFFALIFPIYFFIKNPKDALKTLFGMAVMAGVILIGYLMADATPIYSPTPNADLSNHSVLILTDTGLIATYVLFGVAMFLLLYTGVRNVIRK